eukprot:6117588-Pyramimonas_sp.AAC.2
MTFSQLLAAIRSVESESSIEKLFNETPRLDDRQIGRLLRIASLNGQHTTVQFLIAKGAQVLVTL